MKLLFNVRRIQNEETYFLSWSLKPQLLNAGLMPTIESINYLLLRVNISGVFSNSLNSLFFDNPMGEPPPRPPYCEKDTALVPIFEQPQCKTSWTGTGTLTRLALMFSVLYFGVWVGIMKGCTVRCMNRLIESTHTVEEQVPFWANPLAQYCFAYICHMDIK